MGLVKLKGVIQHYDWGGREFIPQLLGEPVTTQKCAEYWMGAHIKAPSVITDSEEPLNQYINKSPEAVLGKKVYSKFGELPFLFKVLDVADMLSIQVHPNKTEAKIGFEKENQAGIPLTAPQRNYKDVNHKPEIMVALGEFWLLHGFKPAKELIITLNETPELTHLINVFEDKGYKGLYQTVMEESPQKTNEILNPLIERIMPLYQSGQLSKDQPDYWAAKAFLTFCTEGDIDKGIYSIYFFNIVKINAGEAIFQDAGVPHAYIEGQNMELMANSDNVLRGGLTPKHVDVQELLKHVSFSETIPDILMGEIQPDGIEKIFKSPAPDFELSMLELSENVHYSSKSKSLEIMMVMKGDVLVSGKHESINVVRGEVLAVTANEEYRVQPISAAQLYKAKCPA